MTSVALEPIFLVEFNGLNQWLLSADSTPLDGFHEIRFVGDDANEAVRYLTDPQQILSTDFPMVLTGPSGVGKTTLAVGFAARLAEFRKTSLTYWKAVDFSRRYRSACEMDSLDEWRSGIENCGVILIDQLEELRTHPAAQLELVYVLDRAEQLQIPVILTASSGVFGSDEFLAQLLSRLAGGLNISLSAPGVLARQNLIRRSTNELNLNLTDSAVEYVAQQLPVTVPKIRHFLSQLAVKLASSKKTSDDEISKSLVESYLDKFRSDSSKSHCDLIVRCVAAAFKLKTKDIKSESRKQTIALARSIAIYFQRSLLNLSFSKIGANFGGRDHSTIVHSKNKIEKIVGGQDPKNDEQRRLINELRQQIVEQLASIQGV